MRSLRHLDAFPAGAPLASDEVTELHEARILLLLRVGGSGRIDGLTKFAKLDFFVRYPSFYARTIGEAETAPVESSMIRFHYGPWDKRYYQLFAGLIARGLITVARAKRTTSIVLTTVGDELSTALAQKPEFAEMVDHMRRVSDTYGASTGQSLRKRIYRTFDQEVTRRPRGAVIAA